MNTMFVEIQMLKAILVRFSKEMSRLLETGGKSSLLKSSRELG
jgi:hypothetical protein